MVMKIVWETIVIIEIKMMILSDHEDYVIMKI